MKWILIYLLPITDVGIVIADPVPTLTGTGWPGGLKSIEVSVEWCDSGGGGNDGRWWGWWGWWGPSCPRSWFLSGSRKKEKEIFSYPFGLFVLVLAGGVGRGWPSHFSNKSCQNQRHYLTFWQLTIPNSKSPRTSSVCMWKKSINRKK